MINVSLKNLSGEELAGVEINSQASIAELFKTVRGQSTARFALLLGGVSLQSYRYNTRLLDCGISNDTTLTYVEACIRNVVTSAVDHTAKIWDSNTGECKLTLSGHTDIMRTAIVTPDESMVLTVSYDKTAKLWDIDTGEWRHTFSEHTHNIKTAVFSADGARLLTASNDGSTMEQPRFGTLRLASAWSRCQATAAG